MKKIPVVSFIAQSKIAIIFQAENENVKNSFAVDIQLFSAKLMKGKYCTLNWLITVNPSAKGSCLQNQASFSWHVSLVFTETELQAPLQASIVVAIIHQLTSEPSPLCTQLSRSTGQQEGPCPTGMQHICCFEWLRTSFRVYKEQGHQDF